MLRYLFISDSEQLSLESFDAACIAGTLKKFLRELPNPVIPEELYQSFVDAASE